MDKFINGRAYEFIDEKSIKAFSKFPINRKIAEKILELGGKFIAASINAATNPFSMHAVIINGKIVDFDSRLDLEGCKFVIMDHEAEYFKEVEDSEVPMKQPNVSYSYNEIKETLETALEDDAFFSAVKMLSAADAAHVLSLKFGANA